MFADYNYVDPAAPACCQVLIGMFEYFGINIDKDLGTCILTGILTDTGGFQWGGVTPETFEFAAELLRKDVNISEICQKILRNKALRIDLCLVALTIFIPMVMLLFSWNFSIRIIPVFLLCFFFFYYLNKNAHKLYLPKQEGILEKEIKAEEKRIHKKAKILITHSIFLLLTGGILYWIGNQLSIILENLADSFLVPEWIIGIALGFITSIPELITFFESQKHYKEKEDRELGVIEATNNLLASNILNLFIIQSIGILIFTWSQTQIPYQEEILVVKREKRNVIKILKEKFI